MFCADCGLMLLFNPPWNNGFPALGGAAFNLAMVYSSTLVRGGGERIGTGDRRNYLYKQFINTAAKRHGDKRKWRRAQYHLQVGVVHSNLWLTPVEKEWAHQIIERLPDLRRLSMNNDYVFLVAAICVYVMDKNKGGLTVSFDHPYLLHVGLGRDDYRQIRAKLEDIF